jgi:hypothetical protein
MFKRNIYYDYSAGGSGGSTGPVVSTITPALAGAGALVLITGSGFTGATAITLGGIPVASFMVISDTQISAIVGHGASGSVSITTPSGTGLMAGFTFSPVANCSGCNTTPLVNVCADPEYCEELYADKCINHTGNLTNLGVTGSARLDAILQAIDGAIGNLNSLVNTTTPSR